ncbi:hypothetical protein [Streptomyces cinereoruber]|uniref:hypothetical protein n=1 Tax=Streptomyces cinereoruber TaxID=67260 RepID=UPI00362C858D
MAEADPPGFCGSAEAAHATGAVVTVLRARAYGHVPFPLVHTAPAAAVLILA